MLFGRRRSNVSLSGKRDEGWTPPLQVVGFIATRAGDAERGPMVRMREEDAQRRLLMEGELVWVYGPRRHELAVLEIDDTLPRGGVVVRDIAGVTTTEIVRVLRTDQDTPRGERRNV